MIDKFLVVLLFLAAIFSCEHSCKDARRTIVSDMNQALSTTLAETGDGVITPEVAALFRSKLTLPELKDTTYIAYCFPGDKPNGICSDEMHLDEGIIRSYADVTFASVFGLADKRMPIAFSLMAVFWMLGAMMLPRRNRQAVPQLTPMQKQLLDMFNAAPDGELSKDEICNALWPRKPRADETLYSLIRHLKSSLEGTGYEIETRRGFGYRLKKR